MFPLLITLNLHSNREFTLNANWIERLEWEPATERTAITMAGSSGPAQPRVYYCLETIDEILTLMKQAQGRTISVRTPAYGDGPMEVRGGLGTDPGVARYPASNRSCAGAGSGDFNRSNDVTVAVSGGDCADPGSRQPDETKVGSSQG